MSNQLLAELVRQREAAEAETLDAVQRLRSPSLDTLIRHLEMMQGEEFVQCATLDDEIRIRRGQGAVTALTSVIELLKHVPVEKRRSASRHEV